MSEYTLEREIYDTPGLWVQIPYGNYTNSAVSLPAANTPIVQRFWNPQDLRIRHFNFGVPVAAPGAFARVALYTPDAQIKIFDSGLIDMTNIGPHPQTLIEPLDYWSGFYWAMEATTSATAKGLGLNPGTSFNDPILNGGKLPITLVNLEFPDSFDPTTIDRTGAGILWAAVGQS